MENNLENFISKNAPHGHSNSHPPHDPQLRHLWESKQLFTVKECLNESCTVLDYGCGGQGTLQYTLFNHYPNSKYYGLDIRNFKNPDGDKVNLGNINDLEDVLPKVSCMVMGSIFTHLSWEGIEQVLNKTLPYYNTGFQVGFSTFLGSKYELQTSDYYGPDTYHISIIPLYLYEKYCKNHNLQLIVHDYIQELDHILPFQNINHQNFLTIKKGW